MSEGPEGAVGARAEGEREPCLEPAALGFPIVFLTLLGHGIGIYLVRQGHWAPSAAAEQAWAIALTAGVAIGLVLSAVGGVLGRWWRGRRSA